MVTANYIKFDSIRKLHRNQLLKEYAASHPYMSCTTIGEIFGISRQRVLKIIGKRPLLRESGKD